MGCCPSSRTHLKARARYVSGLPPTPDRARCQQMGGVRSERLGNLSSKSLGERCFHPGCFQHIQHSCPTCLPDGEMVTHGNSWQLMATLKCGLTDGENWATSTKRQGSSVELKLSCFNTENTHCSFLNIWPSVLRVSQSPALLLPGDALHCGTCLTCFTFTLEFLQ